MIADGFNSAGDVFTSVMTYLGNKIASSPQDKDHPYGHGKAEYIFSMIISFSLLVVTYQIFRNSLEFIIKTELCIFMAAGDCCLHNHSSKDVFMGIYPQGR